jgi:hypothetical protein
MKRAAGAAELAPAGEVLDEGAAHSLESGGDRAEDLDRLAACHRDHEERSTVTRHSRKPWLLDSPPSRGRPCRASTPIRSGSRLRAALRRAVATDVGVVALAGLRGHGMAATAA